MMKFFRKYNKHLLAVFMALLLIVWLGGTALEAWLIPDPASEAVAQAFGRELSGIDMAIAADETALLDRIGLFYWRDPGFVGKQLEPVDWMLLRREAERMNIVVPPEQVDQFMTERMQFTNERLNQLRAQHGRSVSIDQIRAAVNGFLMVQEASQIACRSAVTVTEPTLTRMAQETLERVGVAFANLTVTHFRDDEAPVTDEEAQAFFEKYKNSPKFSGEGLGFGYQIPTRLRVQFIEADLSKIKPTLPVTEAEIQEYYNTNLIEFIKTPTPPALPATPPAIAPTLPPAPSQPAPGVEPTTPPDPSVETPTNPDGSSVDPAPEPSGDTPDAPEDPQARTGQPSDAPTAVAGAVVFAQDVDGPEEDDAVEGVDPADPIDSDPTAAAPAPGAVPPADPTVTIGAPSTVPPTPAPAPVEPTTEYEPLEVVRPVVIDKVRQRKAAERAEAFMKGVLSDLTAFWDGAPRDEQGFKTAPSAEVTGADHYQSVLTRRQRRGWNIAEHCNIEMTEPFDATVAGAASVTKLRQTRPADPRVQYGGFGQLVLQVKGVVEVPEDDSAIETNPLLAVHQTCPVIVKEYLNGNLYLFRVVEVIPAHAPESLEAVRSDVEADVRTQRAYEAAEREAQRLAAIARTEGIDAAIATLPDDLRSRISVNRPEPFPRLTRTSAAQFGGDVPFFERPPTVQGVFGTDDSRKAFIEECFELARAPTTQPTDRKVDAVARPSSRQWVVVEFLELQPVRRDEYEPLREELLPQVLTAAMRDVWRHWFSPENIRQRCEFAFVGAQADEAGAE